MTINHSGCAHDTLSAGMGRLACADCGKVVKCPTAMLTRGNAFSSLQSWVESQPALKVAPGSREERRARTAARQKENRPWPT